LLFAIVLLSSIAAPSAQKPLEVMLLFDMEGVTGATEFTHTAYEHPSEDATGRESLTADVNAAITGLKTAGSTEIVVVDGHG
jgi:D-aminopeptidase